MSEERDLTPPDDGAAPADDDLDLGAIDADGNQIEPEPDEPEPEPEDEPQHPDDQPERQRQIRRGQVHRLRADLDRERTEKADLVRRIAALEQQRQQPAVDPQAQMREEAEFRSSLEQMLPHEAALAVAGRSEQRMQRQLAQVALQNFDRTDGAEWRQLQATNRAAQRLAQQVETTLQQRRAMGDYTLGRRDILAYLVGQELLSRPAAQAPTTRAARAPRPASGRNDVAGAPASGGRRRNEADADIALLRGITTADI
jgi:hypothetical protein